MRCMLLFLKKVVRPPKFGLGYLSTSCTCLVKTPAESNEVFNFTWVSTVTKKFDICFYNLLIISTLY